MADTNVEARLTRVEEKLERMLGLLEAPVRAANGTNGANGHASYSGMVVSAADAVGAELAAVHGEDALRARLAEALLAMSDPEALDALTRIIQLAPRVEYAVQAVAAGPELLEEGMELARDMATKRGGDPHELQRRLEATTDLVLNLTANEPREALNRLGQLTPGLVPVAQATADATRRLAAVEGEEALTARLGDAITRITEAETLESLTMLAELAPRIEYAAQALAAGPALLEDTMHTVQTHVEAKGEVVDMQARAEQASEVLLAVSRPKSLDALQKLADLAPHLGAIAEAAGSATMARARVEGDEAFVGRVREAVHELTDPETLDAVVRIAQLTPQLEWAVQAGAAAPALLEDLMHTVQQEVGDDGPRVRALVDLAKTATEPKVLTTLEGLLTPATLGALSQAAGKLEELEPLLAKLEDIDLGALTPLLEKMGDPSVPEALGRLIDLAPTLVPVLESLPIQPETLQVLRAVNEAVEASANEDSRVGLFGTLGMLSDPEVQRAVGFGKSVAKRLGAHLSTPASKRLSSGR